MSDADGHEIVARIWEQLGSPTYEELAGRSIYDLIDELKAENKRLRDEVESLKIELGGAAHNRQFDIRDGYLEGYADGRR